MNVLLDGSISGFLEEKMKRRERGRQVEHKSRYLHVRGSLQNAWSKDLINSESQTDSTNNDPE